MEDLIFIAGIGGVLGFLFYALTAEARRACRNRNINFSTEIKPALSDAVVRAHIPHFPKVVVKWIIDGDTVIVRQGWSDITIRLAAIDCPEDGQSWGDTAKYGLIKLIGRKSVHLEVHGQDQYGRTLATIYVWNEQKNEWMNVNERTVMLGHAWVTQRLNDHLPQDRQNKLIRLENWA